MPEWGLTQITRQTEPYGLKPWWLQPGKVVTDPIHGDVFVTRLEQTLLDTPPMQRLRRVRQLGTTHYAYPGATHTRFSHSLGAVRVVQTILDAAVNQRNRNDPPDDLFAEWEPAARKAAQDNPADPALSRLEKELEEPLWRLYYWKWQAEATVLARLGALLHDIGHLPVGHTIEDDLGLLTPHDESGHRFDQLWKQVLGSCEDQITMQAKRESLGAKWELERQNELLPLRSGSLLFQDLQRLILAKEKDKESGLKIDATKKITYPFVADMVGNTICADLLDYLPRDHIFSGLPISLGRRYISSFYITPKTKAGIYKRRMALLIHRKGRHRQDIVTEILKHLRYRYELQERVLVHHTKLAADAMVGKMIELWLTAKRAEITAGNSAPVTVPRHFTFPGEKEFGFDRTERVARYSLEALFLRHGDDGVLEHISQLADPGFNDAGELATMLLNRTLYKPAANAVRPAAADGLYEEFGTSSERYRLEQAACMHAGLEHDWHVVLWIPEPKMRLKLAELLVDDGQGIAQFRDTFALGSDIYEAHKALWTVSVFVHPKVTVSQAQAVLAKLGKETGISWDTYRDKLGPNPDVAPEHLAAVKACGREEVDRQVEKLVETASDPQELAARGGAPRTQDQLDAWVEALFNQRRASE